MSISFSLNAKPQSSRIKKPSGVSDTDSATKNYVREFSAAEAPPSPESNIIPIPPIPNKEWRPNKKLKNLPNLSQLSQSNGDDSTLQFELDPGSNPGAVDNSMGYGLNLRQLSDNGSGVPARDPGETISDFELRKLREDLEKLPEGTGMDEYMDVPVEGFGAALLSGYGWKEGRGIGRNAKEDVTVSEVARKTGRGGLGFTGEFPENRIDNNGNASEKIVNANVVWKEIEDRKEKGTFGLGKVVRIVNGRDMGMKGKIVEVKSGGDLLIIKTSRSNEKVKVRPRDIAEVGSADEQKCMRELKELKVKEKDVDRDKMDTNISRKRGAEEKGGSRRVNWLRNHIRVKIISQELKGGRLFLKKGVVVDVVGLGMCDISIDESRELVQGVDQELLETALPKRGGPVLVLYGKHKGVYGSLLDRDLDKETGVVRDAGTHDFLNVKLDQIAEYIGDPSDFGY